MERASIERINELARLAKTRQLTEAEQTERDTLRKAYLACFRAGFQQQLDETKVEYDDGTRIPLKEALRKPR